MEIRALTPAEQKYTYAQSMQLEGQTSNIGHLRGDFASSGYGFYTTWFDTRPQWKTDEFKKELDEVINSLREDKGLLHNRYDMSAFAKHYPESAFAGSYCTEYGFRVDTEKHAFLFRCNPTKGDYNFYCYCFVSQTAAKSSSHHRGEKKPNAPAVLLTSIIPRLEITFSISASLPSVWNKTERPMSRSPQSRRR